MLREHILDAAAIAHVADLHHDVDVVVGAQKLIAQQISVVLVHVKDDDSRRGHLAQLAHQLAADGSAAAGDQHALPGDIAGHCTRVEHDLLAPKQVGHVDVAQRHVTYLVER